ncbi:MAG: SAM-dependent methyltransferase [Streptosporangiaceae bacterium]
MKRRHLKMVTGTPPGRAGVPEINTTVAHPARIYDYWLGGQDNFRADRVAARRAIRDYPGVRRAAQAQRAFLARAVGYLAADAGIRQFLDIGTGLPTADNTHEVAQRVAPDSRVVYVDNDPLVLAHARALLTSSPQGATAHLGADLRDPGRILEQAAATLDFTQPVAVLLVGILQLIPDADEPHEIVKQLVAAVPAGSWLAISHPASDVLKEAVTMARRLTKSMGPVTMRSLGAVTRFFDGLDLIPPGVVQLHLWKPDGRAAGTDELIPAWCGVARKPDAPPGSA